jgi:hypothetical protein
VTLIEAIKSGKPFRQTGTTIWWRYFQDNKEAYLEAVSGLPVGVVAKSLFLTPGLLGHETWEIQEPTVTITRRQLWEACESAWMLTTPEDTFLKVLANKLGLSDP